MWGNDAEYRHRSKRDSRIVRVTFKGGAWTCSIRVVLLRAVSLSLLIPSPPTITKLRPPPRLPTSCPPPFLTVAFLLKLLPVCETSHVRTSAVHPPPPHRRNSCSDIQHTTALTASQRQSQACQVHGVSQRVRMLTRLALYTALTKCRTQGDTPRAHSQHIQSLFVLLHGH